MNPVEHGPTINYHLWMRYWSMKTVLLYLAIISLVLSNTDQVKWLNFEIGRWLKMNELGLLPLCFWKRYADADMNWPPPPFWNVISHSWHTSSGLISYAYISRGRGIFQMNLTYTIEHPNAIDLVEHHLHYLWFLSDQLNLIEVRLQLWAWNYAAVHRIKGIKTNNSWIVKTLNSWF